MRRIFGRLGFRNGSDELKPGDRYCRTLENRFLETATVIELKPDLAGIPHVRFKVAFDHPGAVRVDEGPRILALTRFVGEYEKQVSEGAGKKDQA